MGTSTQKTRYFPDWKYALPDEFLATLEEYHILKVPLLGQHTPGGADDWCGRTACSMVFNYYQVVQGGDLETRFITHWNGGKPGQPLELCYPGGQRAFHNRPLDEMNHPNLSGASIINPSYKTNKTSKVTPPESFAPGSDGVFTGSNVLGFLASQVLPHELPDRLSVAAQIANDPNLIAARLSVLMESLNSNNPVVFYSGFSLRVPDPIHLIVICGYAYIKDETGSHLWLVVADPATHEKKIAGGMFFVPPKKEGQPLLSGLTSKHDMVQVIPGNWAEAGAALILIRARKLFEENPLSSVVGDLYMDYFGPTKGGTFLYSHRWTPVPPEFLYTTVARSVAFPVDGRKQRLRPVTGYAQTELASTGLFPLGGQRNLHSGVHLETRHFQSAPPAPPPAVQNNAAPGLREVRAIAPGYIVALRMANALPDASRAALGKKGLEQNKLAMDFAGNHNSFLLIRHDVEEQRPPEQNPSGHTPKRFTFYSLYMHLVPPRWESASTYQDVDWLKSLARRDGSLAVLDPSHESFQKLLWLQKSATAGGAASTSQEDFIAVQGGTFSIIGADLAAPQELKLGDEQEGLWRAVLKTPARDLTELHDALTSGKIVTLCHPHLQVRSGELLGYLDEASAPSSANFLHWEILAPSRTGGLDALLLHAEQTLGLAGAGERFFKRFEEKTLNNFFDPPKDSGAQEGELEELLRFAPVSRHAPDTALFTQLSSTYDQKVLKQLLGSSKTLPFSGDDARPAEPEKEPTYPVEVRLENYKNCLPEGQYTIQFTFEPSDCPPVTVDYDGRQTSATLRVPARARKIFAQPLKARSFFLQTGGRPSAEEGLKEDVAHFKRLASVRWRNVVLRHLNEWCPEDIVKQVSKCLEKEEEMNIGEESVSSSDAKAKEIIERFARATGWWAHESEHPVLGPKGDEKPLFADEPDEEQLPKKTLIDNPHPITFTWLLMLMTRHNLLRFIQEPLWHSEEQKQVILVGWLPARAQHAPRPVGGLLFASAVQRGQGKEPVSLQVSHGDWRLELCQGEFAEGIFAAPVEVPGWGAWTIESAGARVMGSPRLEGLPPAFLTPALLPNASAPRPLTPDSALEDLKAGHFQWTLVFGKNCPRLLRGWILVRAWKGRLGDALPTTDKDFTLTHVAIPIVARQDTTVTGSGFSVIDGFVQRGDVKNDNVYITQSLLYKHFLDAARDRKPIPTSPLLAWDLVMAVERIRAGYSTRQQLTLSKLSEDGLSVRLLASSPEPLRASVARAKDEGWIEDAEEAGRGEILIRVKAPAKSHHPGALQIDFDANAAFSELRQQFGAEEQLAVQFGCFFPNGGSVQDARLMHSDTLNQRCEQVDVVQLRNQARGGFLEHWSSSIAEVLHHPMFGEPTVRLTMTGAQFLVPLLGGSTDFWAAVKPRIDLGHEKINKRVAATQLADKPPRLVRTVDFSALPDRKSLLSVQARSQVKTVALKNERITVEDSKALNYDLRQAATLVASPRPDDPFILAVTLSTQALAMGRTFKLELFDPLAPKDIKTKAPAPLKLPLSCINYKLRAAQGVGGMTDAEGIFRAEVDLSDVSAALGQGTAYKLRAVPMSKEDKSLDIKPLELTLPEPLHQETKPETQEQEP